MERACTSKTLVTLPTYIWCKHRRVELKSIAKHHEDVKSVLIWLFVEAIKMRKYLRDLRCSWQ
jgi:hypothetical protein